MFVAPIPITSGQYANLTLLHVVTNVGHLLHFEFFLYEKKRNHNYKFHHLVQTRVKVFTALHLFGIFHVTVPIPNSTHTITHNGKVWMQIFYFFLKSSYNSWIRIEWLVATGKIRPYSRNTFHRTLRTTVECLLLAHKTCALVG